MSRRIDHARLRFNERARSPDRAELVPASVPLPTRRRRQPIEASRLPATEKQLAYLAVLAERVGATVPEGLNRAGASSLVTAWTKRARAIRAAGHHPPGTMRGAAPAANRSGAEDTRRGDADGRR